MLQLPRSPSVALQPVLRERFNTCTCCRDEFMPLKCLCVRINPFGIIHLSVQSGPCVKTVVTEWVLLYLGKLRVRFEHARSEGYCIIIIKYKFDKTRFDIRDGCSASFVKHELKSSKTSQNMQQNPKYSSDEWCHRGLIQQVWCVWRIFPMC